MADEKKIAYTLVGVLVFWLAFNVVKATGANVLLSAAVAPDAQGGALMAPGSGLAVGPADAIGGAIQFALPALIAVVSVFTKIGSLVVGLVASGINAWNSRATISDEMARFANASKVQHAFDKVSERLKANESSMAKMNERIDRHDQILMEAGAKQIATPVKQPPKPASTEE